MKRNGKKYLITGIISIIVFIFWTIAVKLIDVKAIGPQGSAVGFSSLNGWFYSFTGVNMTLYNITDWLGLVPVFVCMLFGLVGFLQLVKRKSLIKVDRDIIFLGLYYVAVITVYLIFEMIPVNYRPVLIDGVLEVSYPSSTTLLTLSVMPTLVLQCRRRFCKGIIKKIIIVITVLFTVFMVLSRLVSGVHWFSDIIGGIILSTGLFYFYKAAVLLAEKE